MVYLYISHIQICLYGCFYIKEFHGKGKWFVVSFIIREPIMQYLQENPLCLSFQGGCSVVFLSPLMIIISMCNSSMLSYSGSVTAFIYKNI